MDSQSYLVTGGCGLQGSSIVEMLRARFPQAAVAVMSRNPTVNTFPGVTYHRGDITTEADVATCLRACCPTVVFHCAAAVVAARVHVSDERLREVNVEGTRLLLRACGAPGSGVKAFVFTSSGSVVQKDTEVPIDGADESWPLVTERDPRTLIYPRTKAESERLVSAADVTEEGGGESDSVGAMRTCSVRPAILYGERDSDVTPIVMRLSARSGVQVGDNNRRFATTYVGNSSHAHILAAEKLLSADKNIRNSVGGKAFFVTNDDKYTFYDFARTLWMYAGVGDGPRGKSYQDGKVRKLSLPVALWVAWASEWWAWLWGSPPLISKVAVQTCTMTRWYDLTRARETLGYKQIVGWEEGCQRAALWYTEHRKEESDTKSK